MLLIKSPRLTWVLTLLVSLGVAPMGCSTNPATGKKQLNALSESEEVAIGTQSEPKFAAESGGLIASPQIRDYVSNLGQQLAAQSERASLPWSFNVLDSDEINAFALPGGKVFITRGLLSRMQNTAQLAGVLGHEIGHVTAQHIGQQMTRQLLVQLGLSAVSQVSSEQWLAVLGGTSGRLYLLSFSRDQETQADVLGLRYMTRLGYSPVAQLQVMEILREASSGERSLEMLSTHPYPETRIKELNRIIPQEYPDYENFSKYRFAQEEYQTNVLRPLSQLPPPRAGRSR